MVSGQQQQQAHGEEQWGKGAKAAAGRGVAGALPVSVAIAIAIAIAIFAGAAFHRRPIKNVRTLCFIELSLSLPTSPTPLPPKRTSLATKAIFLPYLYAVYVGNVGVPFSNNNVLGWP